MSYDWLTEQGRKRTAVSEQGRIVTELMQHLHGCKNNCDVFFGRTEELEKMQNYILGESNKPFVNCYVWSRRFWKVFHAKHDRIQSTE